MRFVDAAAELGLNYAMSNHGKTPLNIMDTAGGGVGLVDVDGDGWLDVIAVGRPQVGLFLQRGGRFVEATQEWGLAGLHADWMGCAAGDPNGDGRPDLLLTGYEDTRLLENTGSRFVDRTEQSGIDPGGWSMSGAFFDLDKDGRQDLIVVRYVVFNETTPELCLVHEFMAACGPEIYDGQPPFLYRNEGNWRFRDITKQQGLDKLLGKSWSVTTYDLNLDGWTDLYVSNDLTPGNLLINERGKLKDVGLESGTAYGGTGGLMGAMGIDIGDYDGDGLADILVNTFAQDTTALFHNDGNLLFTDQGVASGIGVPGVPYVKFGAGLVDLDLDAQLEVLMSGGHIRDNVDKIDPLQSYAHPLLLFDQQPRGHFVEVGKGAGEVFQRKYVGRGIAFGDVDNDGRLDALIGNLEGPLLLLLNRTPYGNRHWLGLSVVQNGSPALGARVLCKTSLGEQFREVRTAYSVMVCNDPRVHFGLSTATSAKVTVKWTDGSKWGPKELRADAYYRIEKGREAQRQSAGS